MRTKNSPYKVYTGSKEHIQRVSPMKSSKKASMHKVDKVKQENGSLQNMPTSDRDKFYTCYLCSNAYTALDQLVQHQRDAHMTGQLYACYQCDGIYIGSDPLIQHQKEAHKEGPLFVLPQSVVHMLGTKDVEKIVTAYRDRLTIVDAGGCHGRILLSVDIGDETTLDREGHAKLMETSVGNLEQKNKNENMTDMRAAIANATALERAVDVLKQLNVKKSSNQKARTMIMAGKARRTKDRRVLFTKGQVEGGVPMKRTKRKQKTGAGKALKKQHVLKVKLRTKAVAKKKKSKKTKKYVCWGCGVSYDAKMPLAEHQINCRERSLCQFQVLKGTGIRAIQKKTIIGTITEKKEQRPPLFALIQRRKLPGLSCMYCGEWYMYKFQLERHKKVCKLMAADTHQFRCTGCLQAFSLRYDQCMHILNQCPSVLDDVSAPNTFVLNKLRNIQEQAEKERMQSSKSDTSDGVRTSPVSTLFCYDCASHIDVKQFREHKLECGSKPPVAITCLNCCERFPTRLEMNKHKRQNHGYRVCMCGVMFMKNSDFLQHRKDNPSHCLSPVVGPTQTACTPASSSGTGQNITVGAATSVHNVNACSHQADVASFVTTVPSEKGKLCRVQVHTSAEGNAITNVTVQFQGQSLDISTPGVDVGTPASVPTGYCIEERRQSADTHQLEKNKEAAVSQCDTALSSLSSNDANPLAALGLVRRSSLLVTDMTNTPTSVPKTNQFGLDDAIGTQPLSGKKTSTYTTSHQSNPKRANHGPIIQKVMLPGKKIGYLVPVSKTTNQQAAVAEAQELLQKVKPQTSNAATTNDSQNTKLVSLVDTSVTLASMSDHFVPQAHTTSAQQTVSEITTAQNRTPPTPLSRKLTVQTPDVLQSQVEVDKMHSTRTTSTKKSHSKTPTVRKSLSSASSKLLSSPRKKPLQPFADKFEVDKTHSIRAKSAQEPHSKTPEQQKPALRTSAPSASSKFVSSPHTNPLQPSADKVEVDKTYSTRTTSAQDLHSETPEQQKPALRTPAPSASSKFVSSPNTNPLQPPADKVEVDKTFSTRTTSAQDLHSETPEQQKPALRTPAPSASSRFVSSPHTNPLQPSADKVEVDKTRSTRAKSAQEPYSETPGQQKPALRTSAPSASSRFVQKSVSQPPEQQKPVLRTSAPSASSKLVSSPRKKPLPTSVNKPEPPMIPAVKDEPAASQKPIPPASVQTLPVPHKPVLRKPPNAAAEKARPTEKTKQVPKRKRNGNAERDVLDDSANMPAAKTLRPTASTSRVGGAEERHNDMAEDKAAAAVATPNDRGRLEENGITGASVTRATRIGVARDVATGKRATIGRSPQSSPIRYTKSARLSPQPSPVKDVVLNVKSQPIVRSKTAQKATSSEPQKTAPTNDTASTTRAGTRRAEAASSLSAVSQPEMAHRPSGLMLIAPVNTDTVRCIRCEMTFTRVRDITAHVCEGRPVSVIVQAELKIGGGPRRSAPYSNQTMNGCDVKEEPDTVDGQ